MPQISEENFMLQSMPYSSLEIKSLVYVSVHARIIGTETEESCTAATRELNIDFHSCIQSSLGIP